MLHITFATLLRPVSGWIASIGGRSYLRVHPGKYVVASLLVLLPHNSVAATDVAGKITVVQGVVTVKKPGIEKPLKLNVGDTVLVGDELRTGPASRAQLLFKDGAFASLSEGTALRVNLYVYDKFTLRRKAYIAALSGMARYVVSVRTGKGSSFNIETGTSLIRANLADFIVSVQDGSTKLYVLDRIVSIKTSSPLVIGGLGVRKNHGTTVLEESAPSRPFVISRELRMSLLRETGL